MANLRDVTAGQQQATATATEQPCADWHEDLLVDAAEGPSIHFMANAACLPEAPRYLHVLLSSDHLVITGIDDLHRPGRSICGEHIAGTCGTRLYRLLPHPIMGVDPRDHTPAAGIATVYMTHGVRRMTVTGVIGTCAGRLLEATELK